MLPDFRIRQRDALLEIARAMTQELDLERLLGRILAFAVELLAGQAGLIALRDETGGWSVAATHGLPPSVVSSLTRLVRDVPPHEDVWRYELPELGRRMEVLTRVASLGLLTSVGLPLAVQGEVLGAIFVFRGYPALFTANDRVLLQSFADQAAIAVRNASLYTQLRREKRRTEALIDAVADGLLILTPAHVVERCNPALARMLGRSRRELIGRRHEEIIRWARIEQGMSLEEAEAGGWPLGPDAVLYVQGDLAREGGAPLPVGITYAPLFTPEGQLLNIIASVRDITHFREAEELKSTFVSIISHELKTPIALIKGYVATLRRDDAEWDQAFLQESLQVIEEEADRLAELVENLLEASRLQAGGVRLEKSEVHLPTLAERLVKRFAHQSDRHTFVVDFPENFPVIEADGQRLEQVLNNLLSNALKYAPGGEVRVSGRVGPQEVVVCVSDEGPGIAPSDAPHIFDRFYRAREAVNQAAGAGLGLYLARAIIEAHGGRIWVDTRREQGARICFSLPR